MNETTFIIVRVIVVMLAVVVTRYLIPVLKQFADDKLDESVTGVITTAVLAAQQTIEDNKEKKAYVVAEVSNWLVEHGIKISTEQLDMLIEAAVYAMKQEAQ